MKLDLKLKGLTRLAEEVNDDTEAALGRELEKIAESLKTDSSYDTLENQVQMLNAFGYRMYGPATEVLLNFIRRLDDMEITYSDDGIYPESEIKKYQNAETLIVAAIDTLGSLRYLETESILDALMDLSLHEHESVQKKAIAGLEALGSYEITVFYGPDQKGGIGPAPQSEIIGKLESLDDPDLQKYSDAIMTLTQCILSPSMETTSSTYNTVTWTNTAVPALPEIVDIRDRSITVLKRIFGLADSVSAKLSLISSLNVATRTHHGSEFGDDVLQMIADDTVKVLEFYEGLIAVEDLPVVQKIEHDAYWQFYHAPTNEVETSAQAIETVISAHAEYQTYKNLIGYEGIFGDWAKLKKSEKEWEKIDDFRKAKASEYAQSITPENFDEWRQRILEFTNTESDDLATFPIFYQFLGDFARARPDLAMRLVSRDTEQIQSFLIPLLRSLWVSNEKTNLLDLIDSWILEGRYLFQCTKIFLENDALDPKVLDRIFEKATENADLTVVSMVVSVAVSNYTGENRFLLNDFFLPAIKVLTAHTDARWVNDFWYRRESNKVIKALDDKEIDVVLKNLSFVEEVDYHADEVLSLIAQKEPTKVLDFFGRRITVESKDRQKGSGIFDAIPYELHKLKEPLSQIPREATSTVRNWYDGNYGKFIYRGARFLKIIFPDFPDAFAGELLKFVKAGSDTNLEFVLAVLRNYEGEPFTHEVCKEIIRSLPGDSSLRTEVEIALESTGVVTGEFGYSEALARKATEVKDWLADPDEKIQAFAKEYIEGLRERSAAERRRAEERIELRKHRYGE